MNTKIVRLRIDKRCKCNCNDCKELFFTVSTVSRIDDRNPENENEMPLFEVQKTIEKLCFCYDDRLKYNLLDPKTKMLYGYSDSGFPSKQNDCFFGDYINLPTLSIIKAGLYDNSKVT